MNPGERVSGRLVLVALFLAGLAAPTLDHFLRPPAARAPLPEQRSAAPLPAWSWSLPAILNYPTAFARHFDDALGWRDKLLRWNSLQQLRLFGRFPSDVIYAGRDGWWYYAENEQLAASRGLKPFRGRELESWCEALERQRDWLRERGIEFLFVLAPNKETIYPEHLPAGYAKIGPTRMEQFGEYMSAHPDLHFLDLRPALLAEKAADRGDDLLYYPLGTHWTQRGSWIAYREIVRALQPRLPCLSLPRVEDFSVSRLAQQGDSWAGRLYAPDAFLQGAYEYAPREGFQAEWLPDARPGVIRRRRAGASCGRLLLLHDSFGYKCDCFLSEHFEEQLQCAQMTLEERLVDEARPEVVIEIFAESKLQLGPPRFERKQDTAGNRARFESATETLFSWDGSGPESGIEGRRGATVEREPGGKSVAITTRGPAETFLTPPLPFPRSSSSILKLVADSPQAQVLDVFFLREGDLGYERSRAFQLELAAGGNEIYRFLRERDLVGRLSIRPRVPGRLVLRRIELRGAGE